MSDGKKYNIAVIAASSLLFTYLHYSTASEAHSLHDIYRELYYIPVFLGALVFGLRGAILSFLLVSVLYAPYIYLSWTGRPALEANKFLHLFLQGFLGSLTGFLVDRERAHREQRDKDRYLAGLGQVSTAIVHDLKNPLLTILGFARRMREGKGDPGVALQAIEDSALTMQKIVHSVLDFAKPIQLASREDDLRDTVVRACDSCKARAEEKGITLSLDVPAEPVIAKIDGFHLERALANLVNNSIDASKEGQDVSVRVMHEEDKLTIVVRDYGSGMDRETLENIFIPFYTKKTTGTGLGMSIAKKIIDAHQGKITINSLPGKGTEMKIELPYRLGRNSD